ncbi:MAG: hypothetical protein KBD28_01305 [Chitinophagaceae bacterium]|nr:hypothetical protein [Chitinophagaceae bacterium]
MKKILFTICSLTLVTIVFAQREREGEEKGLGFRKENVFIGGSLNVGFGSVNDAYGGGSNLILGINPEIGYSFAQWLDAGIVINAIYNSTRYNENNYRYRQTAFNYGVGTFVRIHPFNSFFIQAQPEHNWISYTQKNLDQPGFPKIRQTVQASSFLVGVGYGQRFIGQSSFFTVLLFDLGTERFSPYRDGFGNSMPIIRGGFNWYLKGSKKKK